MPRATKAEKAQHLNVARALLRRQLVRAEAVRQLAREFHPSERQAYRYLESVREGDEQKLRDWIRRIHLIIRNRERFAYRTDQRCLIELIGDLCIAQALS